MNTEKTETNKKWIPRIESLKVENFRALKPDEATMARSLVSDTWTGWQARAQLAPAPSHLDLV